MSDVVRIGILGAGRIARVHAEAYRTVAGAELVSCADVVPDVARQFARDYGLEVAPGIDALLSNDSIDAVIIATPNGLHANQTIAALDAGKHVFCQKPISIEPDEADDVVAVAAKVPELILQYGFMMRFTPPMPDVHAALVDGDFGEPIASCSKVFGWEPSAPWFYDPAQGGGVILDTMVHLADLLLWFFGAADRVYATGGPYVLAGAKEHGSPDNAMVNITHRNGVMSNIYISWTSGYGDLTMDVFGSDGSTNVDFVRSQTTAQFTKSVGAWEFPGLVWEYGYQGEQQHFVQRILDCDSTPDRAAGAGAAREALRLVLDAQKSLDENEVVVCR